jgi:N-acetyl-beta-hexosaminidase
MSQLEDSPACVEYMQIEGISSYDDLLHNFFKKYMTMVADKGFHIDAWEEVFKYETSEGLYDIYDPQMWELDLSKIKLTGYHWYNRWLHYDAPTTGYMMANKGKEYLQKIRIRLYIF